MRVLIISIVLFHAAIHELLAWQEDKPVLVAGKLQNEMVIDGILTGEGGISPYHLENNEDLTWQIGTGFIPRIN